MRSHRLAEQGHIKGFRRRLGLSNVRLCRSFGGCEAWLLEVRWRRKWRPARPYIYLLISFV